MARVKIALLLAICLSINLISTSARPFDEDEDEDDFWGNSDEDKEEDTDKEDPPAEISRSLGAGQSDHTGHKGHNAAIPVQLTNSGDSPPQSWGGNIAGFNETCGGTSGRTCNTNTNLFCSAGRCTCSETHIYIRSQEKCFEITRNDGDCEFNDQCHAGKWGQHSKCDRTTGRCQCYDLQHSGKRETVYVDQTCYIKRSINEPCEVDSECQASMYGGAYCAPRDPNASPSWPNATQVCQCKTGYIWHFPLKACLKIADQDLASDCKLDMECQASPLGNFSRCSMETAKCECHDPAKPGKEHVVFYKPKKTCFPRKDYNDTCTQDDECKASISSMAECLIDNTNGDFVNVRTCQCPEGKTCPRDVDDGDGAFGLGSSTFNLAILTATVLIFGSRLHIM